MTTPPEHAPAPLREVSFGPLDQPLSDDVNRLGALVGQMLAEQRGDDFTALVESIRTAIRRREQGESEIVLGSTWKRWHRAPPKRWCARLPPTSTR